MNKKTERNDRYAKTLSVIERVCNRAIDKSKYSTLQLIIILTISITITVSCIAILMTVREINEMSDTNTNALVDNSLMDIENNIDISI